VATGEMLATFAADRVLTVRTRRAYARHALAVAVRTIRRAADRRFASPMRRARLWLVRNTLRILPVCSFRALWRFPPCAMPAIPVPARRAAMTVAEVLVGRTNAFALIIFAAFRSEARPAAFCPETRRTSWFRSDDEFRTEPWRHVCRSGSRIITRIGVERRAARSLRNLHLIAQMTIVLANNII
jgi:hypothetical protein